MKYLLSLSIGAFVVAPAIYFGGHIDSPPVASVPVESPIPERPALVSTTDIAADMVRTCEESYKVIDGPLERRCANLIDEVQAEGTLEVLSDDSGRFWVEPMDKTGDIAQGA